MALIECKFFSDVLQLSTAMTVILPQAVRPQCKTLWLLHGYSDDHSIWLRRTSIERYAALSGVAVVMPSAHLSYYTDMVCGGKYWTFISEELPALARAYFPLSDRPEDNVAAGLSMGGYGAFKLALRCPDRFAAAASLSGALDVAVLNARHPEAYKLIFGDPGEGVPADDDLFRLAEKAASRRVKLPRLYQCCGTEDFVYGENVRFRDWARRLGIDLTYEEGPGDHEWGYWDDRIQVVLKWFFPN